MNISLDTMQHSIDELILARGETYFQTGCVHEPEQLSPGVYEFIVEGTKNYTVRLTLDKKVIREHTCTCPYDWGPVCKHEVAAMYYLRTYTLGSSKPKSKPTRTAKNRGKKKKTIAEQIDEILGKVSQKEVAAFIRENAFNEKAFRDLFFTWFAHYSSDESKEMYASRIRSLLSNAENSDGFIDWDGAMDVRDGVHAMLQVAKKQSGTAQCASTIYICTAIMEELTTALQFADDSNGDIGDGIRDAFQELYGMVDDNPDEKTRKKILNYCFEAFDKKIYKGWDWHMDMMELASLAAKTNKEASRIFSRLERVKDSEYERETAQRISYDLLLHIKGETEAGQYLERHIANPDLRTQAIKNAIKNRRYDKSAALARDGIAHDKKEKPGLVIRWYDWLLHTAQAQKDKEKIIEYARFLYLKCFYSDKDYYAILKKHVSSKEWPRFLKNLITEISTTENGPTKDLLAAIYIREQWWDKLLALVQDNPHLHTIQTYESYLAPHYAPQLVDMYADGIKKYLQRNIGRKHYRQACRYLRRMIKLNGKEKAHETMDELRSTYPKRRALMDELNRV